MLLGELSIAIGERRHAELEGGFWEEIDSVDKKQERCEFLPILKGNGW